MKKTIRKEKIMKSTYETIMDKIRLSGELTAKEKRSVLTLLKRFHVTARWEIMSEGYITCSHCHEEPDGRKPTPFCPNCGQRMIQPDWLK